MIIGSLKEIMGLNEDGITARRRKAINTALKDPNTRVAVHFDGSERDRYNQMKAISTPKVKKQLDDELEYNRKNIKDYAKDETKPNPRVGAVINRNTKIYAVNDRSSAIKKDGTVDFNSNIMNHETQHEIQDNIVDKLAKATGIPKKEQNKRVAKYEASISTDVDRRKLKNPMEFEANIAGVTKTPRPSMSTYRLAKQELGQSTPKKEFIPSYIHADEMNNRVEGVHMPPIYRNMMKSKDYDIQDGRPVPADKQLNRQKYNERGQKLIKNVIIPNRGLDVTTLDSNKSTSKDPNINKSKNTFIKIKNRNGKTITVPKR